jgi:hypothetical protein
LSSATSWTSCASILSFCSAKPYTSAVSHNRFVSLGYRWLCSKTASHVALHRKHGGISGPPPLSGANIGAGFLPIQRPRW